MKRFNPLTAILALAIALFSSPCITAQLFKDIDKNPQDIVYYRPSDEGTPQIKVVYGRPKAKDDKVFGTQVPFGRIWDTGSNESTEIRFFTDVMFGNKYVKAGIYSLYTIPNKNYWIVILNSQTDTYGADFYDPKFNIATLEVPVLKGQKLENFSIGFTRREYGTNMVLGWAQTRVKIPLYTEERLISKI